MRLVMGVLWVLAGCVWAFTICVAVRALYRNHEHRTMYELPLHERLGRFGPEDCRERFWATAGIDLLDRVTTQADLEDAEHRVLDLPAWAWQHGPGCAVCWRKARYATNSLACSEGRVPDELYPHRGLDPRLIDALLEEPAPGPPLPTVAQLDGGKIAQADELVALHLRGREFLGYLVQGEDAARADVPCAGHEFTVLKQPMPCVICGRPASFPTFFCVGHAWSDWQALVDRTVTVTYRVRGMTSPFARRMLRPTTRSGEGPGS